MEQLVTTTNPFPVGKTGSYFVKSTANSSTAQLAPGAQFVGTIEAIPTALSLSLNIPSDQPLTVTVNGYQSSSPSSIISSQTKYVQAGVGLNLAIEANENFCNVVVTNVGTAMIAAQPVSFFMIVFSLESCSARFVSNTVVIMSRNDSVHSDALSTWS